MDLNDAVGGMLKLLRRLIGEDIELAWHPALALWPVEVDPSQIDQILANLAVNARDAIAGVGRLTLATANVEVDAAHVARTPGARPGAYVRLTVADTGCGMDADVLAHMFEPFFTTKEPGKGTGLGAATVYGIVKQNDGFIEVTSAPGQGTTFAISCRAPRPCSRPPWPAAARDQRRRDRAGGRDEQLVLDLTATMLERLGYAVLVARSGRGRSPSRTTPVPVPGDRRGDARPQQPRNTPRWPRPDRRRRVYVSAKRRGAGPRGVIPSDVQFLQKPFAFADLAARVRAALAGRTA
jgi:hypothetical protein